MTSRLSLSIPKTVLALRIADLATSSAREGLNNPHLGRNVIGCGSKIRFEGLSER